MSEETLKKIYNAFDPFRPANREQYRDCSTARGGSVFQEDFLQHLRLSKGYIRILFSGHIGCGKSSELIHLHNLLQKNTVGNQKFYTVLVDAEEYLDGYDVDTADIFLAMVTELATTMKREMKISLEDNYFQERLEGLKELLFSEISWDQAQVTLFGIKNKITALKRDTEARKTVRTALGGQPSSLLDATNDILAKAHKALTEKGYAGLVLIVDGLEKIQVFGNKAEGSESHEELFIERANLLTGLNSHVIYTVPLRLAREFGPQLGRRYDQNPFVLPMIKVRERDSHNPHASGVSCMLEIMENRLEDVKLQTVFDEGALNFMIKFSGGNTRELMRFNQNAIVSTDQLPVNLAAAQKAVTQSVAAYSTSIPGSHWEKLAQLDLSATKHIENKDKDYMAMLESQSILEYLNGSGDDLFQSSEPWYVVNPIVRELTRFKEAKKKLTKIVD